MISQQESHFQFNEIENAKQENEENIIEKEEYQRSQEGEDNAFSYPNIENLNENSKETNLEHSNIDEEIVKGQTYGKTPEINSSYQEETIGNVEFKKSKYDMEFSNEFEPPNEEYEIKEKADLDSIENANIGSGKQVNSSEHNYVALIPR